MHTAQMPETAELPTTAQLLRSTVIALVAAIVLLVTVILPAEYAVDPTGIGRILGLTEMGEIKQQLADEAEADEALHSGAVVAAPAPASAEAAPTAVEAPQETPAAPSGWTDEMELVLAPGEGAGIKLIMGPGDTAEYDWRAEPGHLNSSLHAHGSARQSATYRNGRAETGDAGEFTADFQGEHGWFWRNRSDETVTMTLRVRGEYSEIKRAS